MDNTKVAFSSRLNLGFNLNYFSLLLNFVHLKSVFFTLHISIFFYPEINKPNIHNNIIEISSFQN